MKKYSVKAQFMGFEIVGTFEAENLDAAQSMMQAKITSDMFRKNHFIGFTIQRVD
jgi:hypothetical protein